jgi:DeoR/GlpR family transcriptional regulator of sugar metabolism
MSESQTNAVGTAVIEDRQSQIVDMVAEQGSVRVAALSRRFGVSQVTIRTDLERLARQGLLVRNRGGAVAVSRTSLSSAFAERARRRQDEKVRIAQRAAKMVSPGDSIFIDAGSTMMEVAHRLGDVSPLTVVTNALNIAVLLGGYRGMNVMMVGGTLSPETISTIGPIAERDIDDLVVDKLFLAAHSFDAELGILDVSVEIARVKMAMLKIARQVVLVADSSKYAQRALAKVAPLSAAHVLITDSGLDPLAVQAISAMDIEVVLV